MKNNPQDKNGRDANRAESAVDRVDPATARDLHDNLKRAFERLANEPVPDKFLDLIRRLEEKERQAKNTDTDDD